MFDGFLRRVNPAITTDASPALKERDPRKVLLQFKLRHYLISSHQADVLACPENRALPRY